MPLATGVTCPNPQPGSLQVASNHPSRQLHPPQVFILCNENNVEQVRAWAADPRTSLGGFPVANVLTNGSDDSLVSTSAAGPAFGPRSPAVLTVEHAKLQS